MLPFTRLSPAALLLLPLAACFGLAPGAPHGPQAPLAQDTAPSSPKTKRAPDRAEVSVDPVVPGGSRNRLEAEPIGLASLLAEPQSEISAAVERWAADGERLRRLYPVGSSPALRARLGRFHSEWLAELSRVDFSSLSRPAQVDLLALRTWIERSLHDLSVAAAGDARIRGLVSCADPVIELAEARVRIDPLDARLAAERLDGLTLAVERRQAELEQQLAADAAALRASVGRFDASRASRRIEELARALLEWSEFYAGYDPQFDWWCRGPREAASAALSDYARFLRERVVSLGGTAAGAPRAGEEDIVGDPLGREALERALALEWIPYSPEELISLAERQFAWCEGEMLEAAKEMGFGSDWKRALEAVKGTSVAPGAQPILVRDLLFESLDFLRERELITIPALAAETWRMEMLSPEAQRQNPFFLGGDSILVSYPTEGMTHGEKRMSMRGNNPHFSRAVVHHELIPGHNLQGFMGERHNPHRRTFSTPFWTEGWALYWELLLYERGFAATPEQRVGMLFWRMHRCARIVFSLKFHLGEMDAGECVDFLEQRVGHERANAAAEVRRSFAGDYGPLYQAGYLLGGLQFQALRKELAGSLGERQFHDSVIRAGSLPVELVRALFTDQGLSLETRTSWRFAD